MNERDYSPMLIRTLLKALVWQCPVIAYYKPRLKLHLHVYTLVVHDRCLYLSAKNVDTQEIETYALDYFESFACELGKRFEVPDSYQPTFEPCH